MILDTLTGRSPFYRRESFFESQDIEFLVGKVFCAKLFDNDVIDRFLAQLFDAGMTKIISEVGYWLHLCTPETIGQTSNSAVRNHHKAKQRAQSTVSGVNMSLAPS
jgi:hypothetical protein